ncbi:MAG: Sua5/YciO/YrdC/YwlC family protein, partial [Bacillota bacterium]|nr:Sua5/YciO/YrdC/YwlC family protein [Bacillota bacterium]
MKTGYISGEDLKGIKTGGEILRRGGLVAFPTETVYGLGADGLNENAVKSIYVAKGRPSDNPLILHITCMEDAAKVAYLNEKSIKMAEVFWPGPL